MIFHSSPSSTLTIWLSEFYKQEPFLSPYLLPVWIYGVLIFQWSVTHYLIILVLKLFCICLHREELSSPEFHCTPFERLYWTIGILYKLDLWFKYLYLYDIQRTHHFINSYSETLTKQKKLPCKGLGRIPNLIFTSPPTPQLFFFF